MPPFTVIFKKKEDIVYHFTARDFEKYCLPVFWFDQLKEQATSCFFSYIRQKQGLYQKLLTVDDGILLYHSLKTAYCAGFQRKNEFSPAPSKKNPNFNPKICFDYASSGTAGIVVDWIRNGMDISDLQMGKYLYLIFSEPLTVIREYYV